MTRAAVDEAKQALWRDKEVERRIRREQEDALERVILRNETLAIYEEVRRRHANDDENEQIIEEQRLPEAPQGVDLDEYKPKESLFLDYNTSYLDNDDTELDPFDIFKRKK